MTGGPCYLKIRPERVSIRNVSTGESVDVVPKLSLDRTNTILSVGDPVDPTAARVLMPFQHPRTLIGSFIGGRKIVQYVFRKLFGKSLFSPSPIVVVHPDVELDGGLTEIEARALREMVEDAGARKVYLHYGRHLTDQEVVSLSFQEFESAL